MIRPLVERAVTIMYLHIHPEKLEIWNDGWDYKKRPSLQGMLDALGEKVLNERFPKGATWHLNSATHGDPFSAQWNLLNIDGKTAFPVSKNLHQPALVDEICAEAIPWLASTMGMMGAAFGDQKAAATS